MAYRWLHLGIALKPDEPITLILCGKPRPASDLVQANTVWQIRCDACVKRAIFAIGENVDGDKIVVGHNLSS